MMAKETDDVNKRASRRSLVASATARDAPDDVPVPGGPHRRRGGGVRRARRGRGETLSARELEDEYLEAATALRHLIPARRGVSGCSATGRTACRRWEAGGASVRKRGSSALAVRAARPGRRSRSPRAARTAAPAATRTRGDAETTSDAKANARTTRESIGKARHVSPSSDALGRVHGRRRFRLAIARGSRSGWRFEARKRFAKQKNTPRAPGRGRDASLRGARHAVRDAVLGAPAARRRAGDPERSARPFVARGRRRRARRRGA